MQATRSSPAAACVFVGSEGATVPILYLNSDQTGQFQTTRASAKSVI